MPPSIHRLRTATAMGSSWTELRREERLAWLTECRRLRRNCATERRLGSTASWIAGVDETGRGPLAGPVVAAAVVMPSGCIIPGLTDSKRLSRIQRERLYEYICRWALAIGVSGASAATVDEVGIRSANMSVMRTAVQRLLVRPRAVLVDGREEIPGLQIPQRAVVQGDLRCNAVAAASIVAKVIRDRIMRLHHNTFPDYSFATNVGYGTPHHRRALEELGPTPVHRRSFLGLPVIQKSLFPGGNEGLDRSC